MSEVGEIGYSINSETKIERKASHLTTNDGGGIWTKGGNAYYSRSHSEIANGLNSNKKNPAEAFFSVESIKKERIDESLSASGLSRYRDRSRDYYSSSLKKYYQLYERYLEIALQKKCLEVQQTN